MNEIELLKRFREEVPEPDHATGQAVRTALMARIEAPRDRVGPRQWPSRRRITLGLTAASAAVATIALLLPIVLPRGATSAAAAELRRFAAVAAQQPAPQPLGPGQYYYLKQEGRDRIIVVSEDHGAYTALYPRVREYWVGADGSGRLLETTGNLIWPTPRDRARGEADGGALKLVGPSDLTYGVGELVSPELHGGELGTLPAGYSFESLPRQPKELHETIRAAVAESKSAGPSPEAVALGTFGLSIRLLYAPLTPPDLRAALFESMAFIPGITVIPEKPIPGIGTGAAVFIETDPGQVRIRLEYLVDPATTELLGYQETQLDRAYWTGVDPPFVFTRVAYARPEVVGSTSERPAQVP